MASSAGAGPAGLGGGEPAEKGVKERSTLGTTAVTQGAPTRWQCSGEECALEQNPLMFIQ